MDFYTWLVNEKGLSTATASKYNLVIKNRISEWLPSYELPQNSIDFEALKQIIESLDIYKERNTVGNYMYSSALNYYGKYLKELDIQNRDIFSEDQKFTSEAEKLIKVRLVQNKFRKGLFDLNQFCVVTGFKNTQFLIASHIKPWSVSSDEERLDPYNGLLLTPNFDRLFDKGLISFRHDGEILISQQLTQTEQEFFNIPHHAIIQFGSRYQKYFEFHQNEIFKKY